MALIMGALAIFWLGRYSDIDLALADMLYDASNHSFPWQHAWLTETFSHVILKWLLMLMALGFVGYALSDAVRPVTRLDALNRLRLRVVALSAVLVPLVISLLKQASSSHCPWDLARYGGEQPYVRIFEALPLDAVPGHCLPAGHASSALWLLSLAVYWLPARRRAAQLAAAMGIIFGAMVGFLQQMRGAHFLTHTLWSIWIACAIVSVTILALQKKGWTTKDTRVPSRSRAACLDGPTQDAEISESV